MTFSKCYSIVKFRVFSAVIIGVVFGLSGWTASADIVQDEDAALVNSVKLVPQGVGDELKVEKNNQCKKGKHDGCLLFKWDESGYIVFHLPGSKNHVKNCSSFESVITKIELTATRAAESDKDDKGDFRGPFPLPTWLKDAFPAIDLDTGIVYEAASLDIARTQEGVSNLNNHANPDNEPDAVESFWYRVTVTACAENEDGTHTVWVSDPRGDNEGNK